MTCVIVFQLCLRSKELWLVQENHATVKLVSRVASRGMKTYSESRIELRNLQLFEKMLDKSSQFLSSEQPSEPKSLDVALNIAGVEKIHSENLQLLSTWRQFDSSFERKGKLVTVEICILCGRRFSNQFEIVSETPFSCDTVGRELKWAVLCSLLCPETDRNIGIGKQGYVFILTDFKNCCFDVSHSRHQSVCQQLFWDRQTLNLLNELIS